MKYKVATENYLRQSRITYRAMCEFLEYRYKLVNPLLNDVKFL